MSALAVEIVLHDPVRKRFFATDLFSESEALAMFVDCVKRRFWPLMGPDGRICFQPMHLVDVMAFELLRDCRRVDAVEGPIGGVVLAKGSDFVQPN